MTVETSPLAAPTGQATIATSINEERIEKIVEDKSNDVTKSSVPIVIRAKKELDRLLLLAATEGDIAYLESVRLEGHNGIQLLRDAVCVSGCSLLHWAAGSNQVGVLEYLLSPLPSKSETSRKDYGPAVFCDDDSGAFRAVDLPVTRCKKSLGRTPLHYACRNGCFEAVRWLVTVGKASIGVKAKQGVTPFQLAVWQNRLEICIFLTEIAKEKSYSAEAEVGSFDPAKDFNDFGCGAVHWLGIAPESRANYKRRIDSGKNSVDSDCWYNDGRDLLPLAKWLASLQGIDFAARQRQNHTALHKASWGGHLAIVKYLHQEHDMWDEIVDDAGNYAASLCDMAHTPKHERIADYLRRHCSRKRAESLAILGLLTKGAGKEAAPSKATIRKAYLRRARQLHPDRLVPMLAENSGNSFDDVGDTSVEKTAELNAEGRPVTPSEITFDALHKAYLHLTEEDGVGDQSNPAHSLNLMLQYVNNNGSSKTSDEKNTSEKQNNSNVDDDSFFKARLVAVLLEYGDKGIDLSNVKKKWKQVWPKIPFPSQQRKTEQYQQKSKKISMADFLLQKAGDVIRFERHGDRNRRVLVLLKNKNSSKESVLRSVSNETRKENPTAGTESPVLEWLRDDCLEFYRNKLFSTSSDPLDTTPKAAIQVKDRVGLLRLGINKAMGVKRRFPNAQFLEFGVHQGKDLVRMASFLRSIEEQKSPKSKNVYNDIQKRHTTFHGFDSFEGLPEDWINGQFGFERGAFDTGGQSPDVENLVNHCLKLGDHGRTNNTQNCIITQSPASAPTICVDNVEFHKGWFHESLPRFLDEHAGTPVAFVHADADLYSSTLTFLRLICTRRLFRKSSVIVFDEFWNYPNWENGEYKAWMEIVDEFNLHSKYVYFGYHAPHPTAKKFKQYGYQSVGIMFTSDMD